MNTRDYLIRIFALLMMPAAISSCAITIPNSSFDTRPVLSTILQGSLRDIPEECVHSLRLQSERLNQISGIVERMGSGADYGIYSRLGGSYLYSNHLLILPQGQTSLSEKDRHVAIEVTGTEFARVSASIAGSEMTPSTKRIALHDECSVVYIHHSGVDHGRVVMSSEVNELSSIELVRMPAAFQALASHLSGP